MQLVLWVTIFHKLMGVVIEIRRPRSEVGFCNNIIAVVLEFGDGYG